MTKIIIRTPNFIGDTIMMLSAYNLLSFEYPNAKFTIVCKKHCIDIFRGFDNIEDIIVDDTKDGGNRVIKIFNLIKRIKQKQYDLGVVYHNTLLDGIIFKFSNINKIIGYEKEGQKFIFDYWEKIQRNRHYVNHYAHLINGYLGFKYKKIIPILLNFNKTSLIQKNNKKNVGFILGGDYAGGRKYPSELSIELMHLLSKNNNFNIVFLGDYKDKENHSQYESILTQKNTNCLNLTGKTSVGEFIDVIAGLDLLVSMDTSAIHIASAVGTKFICFIGKSPSPMELVKPKVNFGSYLFCGEHYIEDVDFMNDLEPIIILDEIERRLND